MQPLSDFNRVIEEKQEAYNKSFVGTLIEVPWYDETKHVCLVKEIYPWNCCEKTKCIEWSIVYFDLSENTQGFIDLSDKRLLRLIKWKEVTDLDERTKKIKVIK